MSRGKKEQLAQLLIGDWTTKLLANRRKQHLSVLAYHSIQEKNEFYPFNAETISAYPDIFDQQMEFIATHFNVITFGDLMGYVNKQDDDMSKIIRRLPQNSLIVTFDDGYADNLTIATPIMQKHGVRSVIYVTTDYADNPRPFWFDEVAYLIRNMPEGPLSLMNGQFTVYLDASDRESQRKAFGQFLQTLSDTARREALEALREIAGFEVKKECFHLAAPLCWDQIRGLTAAGMEVGSHTRCHGFLDMMTEEELQHEIAGSKQEIEKHLGQEVVSFSYPNGNFHAGVVEAVKSAGFHFAVAYDHAIATPACFNPFLIPRIHIETDVSMSLFKANLLLPEIFVR